jgi:hypothetical protein
MSMFPADLSRDSAFPHEGKMTMGIESIGANVRRAALDEVHGWITDNASNQLDG